MVPVRRHERHWRSYLASGGVVLAGLFGVSEAAPQTPGVQTDQIVQRPVEQQKDTQSIEGVKPNLTSPPHCTPEGGKASENGPESHDQGTEFWPPIWGTRIKITDSLIALFTFVLAVVTGGLWIETLRLRLGADQQSKHFEKSVRATEKAAIASEKTADAALLQAQVAEKALVKLERPIIYPGEIDFFADNSSRQIRVKLKNYGRSPAILDSVSLVVSIYPTGDSQTKLFHKQKGFMIENIIGDKDSTDYIIYSDPAISQLWESIEFNLLSLSVSVNVSYRDLLGDQETNDGRWFVWNQKRARFFPGIQVWEG